MELEIEHQKNQELENSNNIQNENKIENKENVELLVEQEVTVENQNAFLQTTLGKTINTALDIGLRGILPDMIEEQIIDIKNVLITNGLKEGIDSAIKSAVDLGKSALGIVTGKFENLSQAHTAVKKGGIIEGISDVIDNVLESSTKNELISKNTGKSVANCKMITDCCLVVLSVVISLIFFGKLVGVREGTVISALTVGFVMKRFMRVFQPALLKFVERDSKLEAAIKLEEAACVDAEKLIITISREYGSEGYEIGKRLAEKLGAEFFDEQLVELEAQESGLSVEFIESHEQAMSHGILYDFLTASYAMYNTDLPPLEKLFAAQTKVIRRIAAEKDTAVIVGRCSDYILYNDPNSFRIFIHANPRYRAGRLSERLKVSKEEAMRTLEKTDSARGRYYRHFAGREWGDMKYYNLAIDTEKFGVDASVELIMEAIALRKKV